MVSLSEDSSYLAERLEESELRVSYVIITSYFANMNCFYMFTLC